MEAEPARLNDGPTGHATPGAALRVLSTIWDPERGARRSVSYSATTSTVTVATTSWSRCTSPRACRRSGSAPPAGRRAGRPRRRALASSRRCRRRSRCRTTARPRRRGPGCGSARRPARPRPPRLQARLLDPSWWVFDRRSAWRAAALGGRPPPSPEGSGSSARTRGLTSTTSPGTPSFSTSRCRMIFIGPLPEVRQEGHLAGVLHGQATSRWCCAQLPVTRRDRIFPRSETNLRSMDTSL